jgi:hypothetical protein
LGFDVARFSTHRSPTLQIPVRNARDLKAAAPGAVLRQASASVRDGPRAPNGRTDKVLCAVLAVQGDPCKQRDAGAARDHLRQRRQARGADRSLDTPGALADRESLIAKAVAVLEQQHGLAVERVQLGRSLRRGQRMIARGGEKEGIAAGGLVREIAQLGFERENACVELAAQSSRDQRLGLFLFPEELQFRKARAQRLGQLGQQVRSDGRNHPDASASSA